MRNRSLWFVLIMSILTLCIYDIYWAFSTRDELVKKGQDVPTPWIMFAPLLGLVMVVFLQIFVGFAMVGTDHTSAVVTAVNIISVIVGIVAILGIIPASIYWLWKYCKGAEKVTHGNLDSEFSFLLAIVLNILGAGIVWPMIMQHQFNRPHKQSAVKPA